MRIPLVKNAAKKNEADMYVYGQIGSDFFSEGITDSMVAEALDQLDGVDSLNVHIDSPGGDAFQGLAIYNLLTSHPVNVTTIVDGWAASAASVILQAGDQRKVAENGMVMIHNAWTFAIGNKAEMSKQAGILDKLDQNLALTYAARSGDRKSISTFADLMAAESWFTGREAVDAGLADSVIKTKSTSDRAAAAQQENSILMRLRFAAYYKHAPNSQESSGYVPTERELEHSLRSLGCSKSVARTLIARMFDGEDGGKLSSRWDAGNVESEGDVADFLKSCEALNSRLVEEIFKN